MKLLIKSISCIVLSSLITACPNTQNSHTEQGSPQAVRTTAKGESNHLKNSPSNHSDKSNNLADKASSNQKNLAEDTLNQANSSCDNRLIVKSFNQQKSNIQVKGCGQVVKVLADDTKGNRHQKFVVKLTGTKQTVLIAHNIDLAPRVADLQKGDTLTFYGEYEYSEQGGVVHWTHKDPAARHQDGWIDKNGHIFQ